MRGLMLVWSLLTLTPCLALGVEEYHVTVHGTTPEWTSAGVALAPGDTVVVEATGCCYIIGNVGLDPDGREDCGAGELTPSEPTPDALCTTAPRMYCLCAKVGDADCFFAGKFVEFVADSDGELLLGFNDDLFTDNGGAFEVTIRVNRLAEPAGPCPDSETLFVLGSSEGWTPTGFIAYDPTEVFWIRGSGWIHFAPSDDANPEGCRSAAGADSCFCRLYRGGELAPGLLTHALVGRIGSGDPFFVGSDLFFQAGSTGELELAFNDQLGHFFDNSGAFQVTICKNPCDTPAAVDDSEADNLVGRGSTAVPNPFRDRSRVTFSLAGSRPVGAIVVDASGRSIRVLYEGVLGEGQHSVEWDGLDALGNRAAAGVYFVRVQAGGEVLSRRLVRLQ